MLELVSELLQAEQGPAQERLLQKELPHTSPHIPDTYRYGRTSLDLKSKKFTYVRTSHPKILHEPVISRHEDKGVTLPSCCSDSLCI